MVTVIISLNFSLWKKLTTETTIKVSHMNVFIHAFIHESEAHSSTYVCIQNTQIIHTYLLTFPSLYCPFSFKETFRAIPQVSDLLLISSKYGQEERQMRGCLLFINVCLVPFLDYLNKSIHSRVKLSLNDRCGSCKRTVQIYINT